MIGALIGPIANLAGTVLQGRLEKTKANTEVKIATAKAKAKIMEKQAVIVFPHIPKKLIHRWRTDPVCIIFTINQLFAIGGLDYLIVKFQTR